MSMTKAQVARHYGEGSGLDTYKDCTVDVERDGENSVLVDVTNVPQRRAEDYPWGRPGVSLELSSDEALDLAISLLWAAVPLLSGEINEALIAAHENLA